MNYLSMKNFKRTNILLIQPLGDLDKPDSTNRSCSFEPLGLEYLQASLDNNKILSSLHYGNVDEKAILNDILLKKPLAVCFSVYTYQYEYCLQLAQKIKDYCKKFDLFLHIIFGGYHSTALPEEIIKNEQVDFIVIGEGEITLNELLNVLIYDKDLSTVKGIYYKNKENEQHIFTGHRERIKNIDSLPFPKRHKEFLANTGQLQITYPVPSKQKNVAQVIYSRGCPYSCIFCSSENMWGKSVAWRNPIKVLDEIEYLYEQYGTNLIYFPDLTFNANKKKVEEICKEFIKRNLPIHWWALFRLDRLDKDMLHMLKEAKCVKLTMGFEADDADAIQLKDKYSICREDYKKILFEADDLGLIIKLSLIIGFSSDTAEKIKRYKEFILDLPIDEIRVNFITPFPGTKVWEDYKRRNLLPKEINLEHFTTENPVIIHETLTNEELLTLKTEIVLGFYSDNRYSDHVFNKIKKHPHLKESYYEYFKLIDEKGIFANDKSIAKIIDMCEKL